LASSLAVPEIDRLLLTLAFVPLVALDIEIGTCWPLSGETIFTEGTIGKLPWPNARLELTSILEHNNEENKKILEAMPTMLILPVNKHNFFASIL
jgi:hypothetical protein